MNPSYTEYKFPVIKVHTWSKVFKGKAIKEAIELISKILVYEPEKRLKPLDALTMPFFDELREEGKTLPNGNRLPESLFKFSKEEIESTSKDTI
jgi:serine/threonine protein kinase